MSQPHKKPSGQPAAKLASNIADKSAKTAYTAVETTRNSTENVVRIGGDAMREFLTTSTGEAQKTQEKVFAYGRERAENLAKSADAVSKMMYEAIGISRDNVETCIECGNTTAALIKDMSSEIAESANKAFSDNVEISKELFACRTINDMLELQNRVARQTIDNFFNQSVKLSGMFFEYSTEALEPINERVAQVTEQFSKALAS